ncbi:metallophosphoesterase family protein [Vibrio sp. WXL210]|uniref:metallophosphoesterase family protein n=1 Tax=Vibrio sp. WXL210 TaxID=3450709 RepID=UPI003EC78E4E
MRVAVTLLTAAILTACNSSNDTDKPTDPPIDPPLPPSLTGYAVDDFVLGAKVTAISLDSDHVVEVTTSNFGRFAFPGGDKSLKEDETYLIEVEGGRLNRAGLESDKSFETSFEGHKLSALVVAGELEELIINPLTTGISQYVVENQLGYADYQQLLSLLPSDVQRLNTLGETGFNDLNELAYAMSYFTNATSTTGYKLDGLANILESLADNGILDEDDVVTPALAEEYMARALFHAESRNKHINSAGQYTAEFNSDESALRIGIVPDTQGDNFNNSWLLQDGIMNFYAEQDVDLVLAVGDITNMNTQYEYDHWLRVMDKYLEDSEMKILPVRGNHEIFPDGLDPSMGANIFRRNVNHMTEHAEQMPNYEGLTYASVTDNVLVIMMDAYIHDNASEIGRNSWVTTFPWIKEMVEKYRDQVDHIFLATHDPMFGRRRNGRWTSIDSWGSILDRPTEQGIALRQEVMEYFADNNITYVSGHDHQYARSVILADEDRNVDVELQKQVPVNYFDHMISGNASFKEYSTRYFAGAHSDTESYHERIVGRHTMSSLETVGLNASIFNIQGNLIDYTAYVAPHKYKQSHQDEYEANENWDAFDYEGIPWLEIDRFSKVKGAHSFILDSESNNQAETGLIHLASHADDDYVGTQAQLLNYINYTFNTYNASGDTGGSYGGEAREQNQDTLLTFSFLSDANGSETITDVLLVSGTQQQDGAHLNHGGVLQATNDERFHENRIDYGEEIDGFIGDNFGDLYALGFVVPKGVSLDSVEPARFDQELGQWVSMAHPDGALETDTPFQDSYLQAGGELPDEVSNLIDTDRHLIHGIDSQQRLVWFLSNQDGHYALVNKGSALSASR